MHTLYHLKNESDFLFIPLKRSLNETEMNHLDEKDISYEIITNCQLDEVEQRPNSYLDLLEEKFTEDELALAPRSFDTIGDIVVIEITDELWDKKQLIGEAILEAHSSISTVFAKAGKIRGVKRIRPIEFIAGDKKTKTIYKEYGVRYVVDIAEAYFSPRLSEEHTRISEKVSDEEIIVDMFCGVGPFVIPIAKKTNSKCYAIDINPQAIALLKENIQLNKLKGEIIPFIGDCRKVVQEEQLENIADRVIMNLPGYAIDFIDVACQVLKKDGGIIHFFEFVGGDEPEQTIIDDLTREVEKANRTVEKVLEVRRVRMSAPRQWQMVIDAVIK